MTPRPRAALMPDGAPVRLAAGAHSSPDEGVCVVELASMIAREDFSDRPRCVCPVIGAFLRGWNDRAPYAERQRLGPYAARIVGSRGSTQVTRERRNLCLKWAGATSRGGGARGVGARIASRLRVAAACGLVAGVRLNEGTGDYAARVATVRGDQRAAFELLEALLAIGEEPRVVDPLAAARNGHSPGPPGNGHVSVNGNGASASAVHGRSAPAGSVNGNGNGYGHADVEAPVPRRESRASEPTLGGRDRADRGASPTVGKG